MNRIFDRRLVIAFIAFIWAVPAAADSKNAAALFDKMLELESRRAKGVSDYAMDITMTGHDTTLFYERVSIPMAGGKPIETFRLVSFDEMKQRQQAGQGMPPDAWQAYSDELTRTGSAMSKEINQGMNEAGLPSGMVDAIGSDPAGAGAEPWASPNPSTMMSRMAIFAEAAGSTSAEGSAGAAEEEAMAESMMLFRKRAEIVGKERIGKRTAVHARAEDLNVVEEVDGEKLTINAISLWIDAEKHVPLKMRMDGVVTQGRKSQEVFIERLDDDYRTVPESKLYMPYRNVMRTAGLLGPEERKEMEDARKQLEDFDKQLASMSPEQRAMVQRAAGSQIEMLRKMVDSGEMTVVTTVRAIRVNTGLAGAFPSPPPRQPTASAAAPAPPDAAASPSASPTAVNAEALKEAQATCLQQKIDAAKKKKRAFGRVMKAAANTVSRYGGAEVSSEVEKASREAYKVDATSKDVEEAAEALGLSKEDVESCRDPK
ncbi:MAG: hypothetical protein AMS18_01440 [Gemmatimonas sp. SG8_17]|nr:MAG: hypothetical protein AMS18_01440 [Gemmatimonas sp. SG8_17]